MEREGNRLANWALSLPYAGPNVTVAFLCENRPEFIFTVLGLAKAGMVTALINTNLKGAPLIHSITIASPVMLIVGEELLSNITEIQDKLPPSLQIFVLEDEECLTERESVPTNRAQTSAQYLSKYLKYGDTNRPSASVRARLKSTDPLFYIYTSGTTGLPKASKFSHLRFFYAGFSFATMLGITAADRLYCVLPLYHSAGGVLGVGSCWHAGSTLVLRRKFSASKFWEDCCVHQVTVIQYIGELCRYLTNCPVGSYDRLHQVRIAFGNGLNPVVWKMFDERFGIPLIAEFYASTEGNTSLINNQGKMGAVGYIPRAWPTPVGYLWLSQTYFNRLFEWIVEVLYPVRLVRVDKADNESILRDARGYASCCSVDESGELLGRINMQSAFTRFDGYTDAQATKKKLISDVFTKGDLYFRSGDLLRQDVDGFVYFVDRIGDTFRWKGENVATSEVQNVIQAFTIREAPLVLENNVYGVKVGNLEGRAGMAALVVADDAFLEHLADFTAYLNQNLPAYAQPLFLRLKSEMIITGTFKQRKVELVEEGFDRSRVPSDEKLFFRSPSGYVELTPAIYTGIESGTIRL